MSKTHICFLFFFMTIILDFCGADRVVERIDVKILEKQYRFQEKNNKLENIKNSSDLVKNLYADLTSARTDLMKTYKTYFIQKTMCQGLSGNLEIIEQKYSIHDNVCLAPPLDPSAIEEDEIKINETSCNSNFQRTKILLDSQLKSSKITSENAKISEFQSDLDSLLEELKIITTYIKSQATDLKLENL